MRKPAPRVVRLVALALLDDARHAARQFRKGDGTDPELLHANVVVAKKDTALGSLLGLDVPGGGVSTAMKKSQC